jgi:hypothetical protein
MQIRKDLTESHSRLFAQLAEPGTWLSAIERASIVAELRIVKDCRYCTERKAVLAPKLPKGSHTTQDDDLNEDQVELIHRLVSDPGRISRIYVDSLLANGMTDGEYVEISAIVSAVVVADTFDLALGRLPRTSLEPIPGEPSQRRPQTAAMEDAFVPLIAANALEGDYSDLYDTQRMVPNVHRAFSLVPDCTRIANDLMASHYLPYEWVPLYKDEDHNRAIDKMQMELIASRVSRHNDCFY